MDEEARHDSTCSGTTADIVHHIEHRITSVQNNLRHECHALVTDCDTMQQCHAQHKHISTMHFFCYNQTKAARRHVRFGHLQNIRVVKRTR